MTPTQQSNFEAILDGLTLPNDPREQVLCTETSDPNLCYFVDTHQGPYGIESTLRAVAVVDGKSYIRITHLAGVTGVAQTQEWTEVEALS